MTARLLIGDVHQRLEELPDRSVDLCMTSPPFLALRSYLPDDHPLKRYEIGSERTPAEFIDTLLTLTAELARVLAPHGSLCVELGDTYAGSGGAGGDYRDGGWRELQSRYEGSATRNRSGYNSFSGGDRYGARKGGIGWPLPKSLTGIPTLYAWSLAYGINLLTGQPSPAGQWRIRNLVHWVRPNPPVGALGDKFRPATSYLIVACKSAKRWFDLDAVREQLKHPLAATDAGSKPATFNRGAPGHHTDPSNPSDKMKSNPAGAPPLDWWKITTRGYKGSHYAVYPPELCERPIKAMCPERVCTVCGEPSRRIVKAQALANGKPRNENLSGRSAFEPWRDPHAKRRATGATFSRISETVGWSDCGHNAWRPGVVLDPFAGTGTTLLVAHNNNRDSIGIDLDIRNAALASQRLGENLQIDYGLTPNQTLMDNA